MPLNKQMGNMYPFVTHTWNPVRGKCPHDCSYCYMKIRPQPKLHFVEKEMNTNLGKGNFIFVGSSTDMWADAVPERWIKETIEHCKNYQNEYLFQSKNPRRFVGYSFPVASIIGTTMETNRDYGAVSKAPSPSSRYLEMLRIDKPKMVSIEPIMDFDLEDMVWGIKQIAPEFVSIGADSKHHNLPEPPPDKIRHLVKELRGITTVIIKDNLKRLVVL